LLPLGVAAVTLDIAKLPDPAFTDRDVSGDAALPPGRLDRPRVFRLELSFASTPSNNVQVAFGRDSLPSDGKLAAEEPDFVIGWDCGEWFLRPQGLRERFTFTPATTNGTRTLTASIRMTSAGAYNSPVFRDGSAPFAFAGLQLSPFPDWMKPDLWTHLRVTVRGADVPDESVKAVFAADGARIIIK
jgi:hypothetical protein